MRNKNCYIYTRVSTSMQVDSFSLEAQKEKLRKYAEFQEFTVAGEYSDEGKSSKNIEGRPEFQCMLNDMQNRINSLYDEIAEANANQRYKGTADFPKESV